MANLLSFLKVFKKKKNETKPKVVVRPSYSVCRPITTNPSGVGAKQNSGLTLKSPQKMNQKVSDLKTSKTQSLRKQTTQEKERRIELVGNYLKNVNKQKGDIVPLRPQRKLSKDLMKATNTAVKELKPIVLDKKPDINRNQNTSLDSIIEMNSKPIIKTETKLQKTGHQLKTTEKKSEDQIKRFTNEKESTDLVTSKVFDFVDSQSNGLNGSQTSLHFKISDKSANKPKEISGLVPIRDIDLKTAKCLICLRLVSNDINLTVCSHIFCGQCLKQWLPYSQHCLQCRSFISSFGHSIRTQFDRICIRSEKDYKVIRVSKNESNFVDSLGAAYLFDAFLSNREVSKYLDSNIANTFAKISDLEAKLTTNGSVQRNVNIRYRITEETHKLEEFQKKRLKSEENFKEICNETNPQMLSFWKQVLTIRVNSE